MATVWDGMLLWTGWPGPSFEAEVVFVSWQVSTGGEAERPHLGLGPFFAAQRCFANSVAAAAGGGKDSVGGECA